MASASIGTPGFAKLIENAAVFAMQVQSGADSSLSTALESTSKNLDPTLTSGTHESSPASLDSVDRAKTLTAAFEETDDIQHSNQAISILESFLERTSENDPDRHFILFHLSLTLCRRVEIQLSKKRTETLVDLHRALTRCLFLLRQAVNVSPATFDVKVQYLAQLGHIASLWSTLLSSSWSAPDVLALCARLQEERNAADDPTVEKTTGFVSAVITASTLSTAFGLTQLQKYRDEGREVYRHTLGSMSDLLPLDAIIDPISSMDFFQKLQAFSFITEDLIPFIVQVMALLVQRLVESPISAVVGRRLAALAIDKGFHQYGVGWLEQCLMLIWGRLNIRPPAPLDTANVQGVQEGTEGKMERIVLAFLGLCIYVDVVADGRATIAHPEQIAYFLVEEWLKLRKEDPTVQALLRPPSFSHILNAARATPVVMLNLWGSQCDAVVLLGQGDINYIRLDGVTEDFAAKLQSNFREGLQSDYCSYADEIPDENRGLSLAPTLSAIHYALAALWKMVVKPILDKMELKPVENDVLDPPRLTWCPTGPTSFFPLHAAGLYDSQERGSKTYEYVASSYTPTLSILANANISLSREPEPFKGILAVSQPSTEGQRPLPKTVMEIEALIKTVDGAVEIQWLNGAEATKEAVLSGMQSSSWVHLACHALQYPLNASESAFILTNGETLSLADISAHASADRELAFLSACQTAGGDFDLSEEGVHLAAGMLVAGYRSVIAATWSVHDNDAPFVAEAVYRRLLHGGQVNRTGMALALHHATRELREKVGEDKFLCWAPFIHLGI